MRLACQENMLPGSDITARWHIAQEAGFDAIELNGDASFAERVPNLQSSGVVFSSICAVARTSIVDFDPERRTMAMNQIKTLLSAAPELRADGVISAAGIGLIRSLPRFTPPPRAPEEDRELLLAALTELGVHAERAGAVLYLEPLNRYEDHILRRLDQAVDYCKVVGSPAIRVMADTFHMSIEEDDPPDALRRTETWLGHVHLADSNRLQPGVGHTDFGATFSALREIGFDGTMAFECGIRGQPEIALSASVRLLRDLW
jgi:sugar phosphate isomerase/epimerase